MTGEILAEKSGGNRAMAEMPDYYEILQVSPNADDEVIQAAFKRLALKWHPDRRPGDPSAPEQMKLLNTAYEVLSNPQKRKAYDAKRLQAAAQVTAEDARPAPERPKKKRASSNGPAGRTLQAYFSETSRVQNLACGFVVLSLADLLVTYLLLRTGPHFYEANPVARWFFQRWNILGMTLFKFAIVGITIALSEVIERHRPGWGRLVLWCCCGLTAYAIARGVGLLLDLAS